MLPLPDLNDQNFEDIFEASLKQIEKYSDVWKDTDIHDPGITLIELLAHLKTQQQEKIDTIGTRSLNKFLKLLDIEPRTVQPATTWVCFNTREDIYIPKWTKLKAEDLIFETRERILLLNNTITHLAVKKDEQVIFREYEAEDTARTIEIFDQNITHCQEFYIAFENFLPTNEPINIYLELYEEYPVKRNPITDKNSFINISEIVWEYYGDYNGVTAWHSVKMQQDDTYNLLYSGGLCFNIEGIHRENEGLEHKKLIRVRVIKYGYEIVPKLTAIKLNCIELIQQDTKCEQIKFIYSQYKENSMFFDSYLGYSNCHSLYIRYKDGFILANQLDIDYQLAVQSNGTIQLTVLKQDKLEVLFEHVEAGLEVFKLVLYTEDFFPYRIIGSTSDWAEQSFFIKDIKNILYDSFELMVGYEKEKQVWELWEKRHTLDDAKACEQVYILNSMIAGIQFGNNILGKVPAEGADNICVISCKTTQAMQGNIKEGVINSFYDSTWFKNTLLENISEIIQIIHFKQAINGCDRQTIEEQIQEATKARYSTSRAITTKDYEEIAKSTQGLMLQNATAIPLYKPGIEHSQAIAENAVTVVIEAYNRVNIKYPLEGYIENVKRKLCKAKLLTTQIYVAEPKYFGLEVYGEAVVKPNYKNIASSITQALNLFINNTQTNKLGETIYYGDICSVIENMEAVIYLKFLKLEIQGASILATTLGDLKIPPYARVYLKTCSINITTQ
jgi:hypothetical protein